MILYLLQSAVVFTLLFLVWMFFFRRMTHFQWQRFYLLSGAVVSLLIPLISFADELPWRQEVQLPVFVMNEMQNVDAASSGAGMSLTAIVYVTGVCIFGLVFIGKLLHLLLLTRGAKRIERGVFALKVKSGPAAFSFFRRIYISDNVGDESRDPILTHEKVHVRQLHSVDIFFFELLVIFFWFNPLYRLARKELALTHEFIADEQACGDDAVRYKQILVAHMLGLSRQTLIHSFSDPGGIKRRLTMITNSKSSGRTRWSYLLCIPALAIALAANAVSVTSCTPESDAPVLNTDGPAKMAEFKGGTEAMMKYLADNILYPQDAKDAAKEGVVYISFTVTAEGKISDVKVMKSVFQSLDEEALRVVKGMPDWTPGEKDGKKVATTMTLPINFSLN